MDKQKINSNKVESQPTDHHSIVASDQILLLSQVLLSLFLIADILASDSYEQPSIWILGIPLLSIALFVTVKFTLASKKLYLLTQAIYYLLAFILLVFVVPLFGTYFLLLIPIIFGSIYWQGTKGLIGSLAASFTIIIIGTIYQYPEINSAVVWIAARSSVLIGFSAMLFWRMIQADINQRKNLEFLRTNARIERDRMHALINSMDAAVIATDEKGKITLYNGATLDLLNTNVTLDNQPLKDILKITDENKKKVDIIHEAQKKAVGLRRSDIVLDVGDNDHINLQVSVSPVHPSFGQQIGEGYVVTMRDITKEKSLDEERDDFISVTSHELRTPIAISEANLSTALLDKMSVGMQESTKKLIVAAHDNIIFLAGLVGDLATLARAEKKILNIDLETINPIEVLQKLESDYIHDIEAKGLKIEVKKPSKVHSIITSRLYVQEVLQNFMTNAIKYTKEGTITIGVEAGEKNLLTFWVKDSGIGISKTDQKKLFEKFFRSEDYRTRESGGTGLGLYITKKLAERINGTIRMSSEINKGSTFYLDVPPIGAQKQDQRKVTSAEVNEIAGNL